MSAPIALITGGGRGLGRNAALHLARRGIDLVITYRHRADEALSAVAEIEAAGAKAVALALDVGDSSSFAPFAASLADVLERHWQRRQFDFLLNNAGIGVHASFAETSEAQFDVLMNIHLKGPFFLTQQLLPMIRDGGRILNVSSGLARFTQPGYAAYGTMKAGVEALTRYLARELGPRAITVNVIAPGPVETDFGGGVVRDNVEVNRYLASLTALGRVGVADDIGGVIAALLSDDCRWINGQRIEVAGGMLL